jgi:hypothetical protein
MGCMLAHVTPKTQRLQIKFGTDDVAILRKVSEALGLDTSATFRTLLREKDRQLTREALLPVPTKRRPPARG